MGVDWGFAGQIGGFGFGLVFVVLLILAAAIWVVGFVVHKASTGKSEAEEQKVAEQTVTEQKKGE